MEGPFDEDWCSPSCSKRPKLDDSDLEVNMDELSDFPDTVSSSSSCRTTSTDSVIDRSPEISSAEDESNSCPEADDELPRLRGSSDQEDDDDDNSTLYYGDDSSSNFDSAEFASWHEQQVQDGTNPRTLFNQLTGYNCTIPDSLLSDLAFWKIIYPLRILKRQKLPDVTSFDDVIELMKKSSRIIVLTGAGVSVSCGIPDFRSKDGVYARLAVDFPNLPDPQAMFDIGFFRRDPRPFFKFAREIYPGQFKPSPSHRFIQLMEKHKKLLRNYTQNIDTLEKVAGIQNVIECHGSFATASCTICHHKVNCEEIKEEVFQQKIPYCKSCSKDIADEGRKGVMKPDIVFFGEDLPESFHDAMAQDKDNCDLLIVIGSSLKVQPVALIPSSLPAHVPQILINRERLPRMDFDVELLGDSDVIVDEICRRLGPEWADICWRESPLIDCTDRLPPDFDTGSDASSDCGREAADGEDGDGETNQGTDGSVADNDAESVGPNVEESAERSSVSEESPTQGHVRCQKIGRRHVADDEHSRHESLDSSRDSGIGDNSNDDLPPRQPIPGNVFYRLKKRRYIFPGAEDPDVPELLFNNPV